MSKQVFCYQNLLRINMPRNNSECSGRKQNGDAELNDFRGVCGKKKLIAENCGSNELLNLQKVPHHLQFNPFVLTGYRPQMNTVDCIMSLTYLHNETINILSHGLPLLYAIWSLPNLLPWQQMTLPILPYFHAAATVSPWLGSSIYHLFMNHYKGEETYERLLQWDVVGVWVTQSCGGFTTVYVGIRCLPWLLRYCILGLYLYFALKSLYAAVFAQGPWQRRHSFAAMFLMRVIIMFLRLSSYGGGHPEKQEKSCSDYPVLYTHITKSKPFEIQCDLLTVWPLLNFNINNELTSQQCGLDGTSA